MKIRTSREMHRVFVRTMVITLPVSSKYERSRQDSDVEWYDLSRDRSCLLAWNAAYGEQEVGASRGNGVNVNK